MSKAAIILWLCPSLLASSQVTVLAASRSTSLPVRGVQAPAATQDGRTAGTAFIAARRSRHTPAAAARATERKLLLLAPRKKLLRRFVDRTTGLVKRNVAAHCARFRGRLLRHGLRPFVCRVWTQPRLPRSGVAVVCHTQHHEFRVTAYHRRSRRHSSRRL
jgi:hypothetical protein